VVTLQGDRHAERVTASILAHAGLDASIARDEQEYVEMAVRLLKDVPFRESLAGQVRDAASATGFSDPAAYARALEDAYLRALSALSLSPLD
jgi:protein O-GlcNAc transferase